MIKQLIVSKRKVLRFTRFPSNVRKAFADIALSALKVMNKAIAQKIHKEFRQKSAKTSKLSPTQLLSFTVIESDIINLYSCKS